jgi:hypothetical protein
MRPIRRLLPFVLLCCACGDQDSSPVPQPVPGLIRQSTPEIGNTETLVAGLPGAVAGKGTVHLHDKKTGKKVVTSSTNTGSFAVTLPASETESLEARFENADGLSDPVPLDVRSLGIPPELVQTKYAGLLAVVGDDVVVSNDQGPGNPPSLEATPNVDVVVANQNTGEVVESKTDDKGLFKVTLKGKSGDTILVMLSDPARPDLTSDFVSATVP